MNSRLARVAIWWFAASLLFPQPRLLSQELCVSGAPNPNPKIQLGNPGHRLCCALGTHSGVDPTKLSGHTYGNSGAFPQTQGQLLVGAEPVGYVYTAAAGLVDLGHVRDNADLVFSVYVQLLNGWHTIDVSADSVSVPPTIPTAKDQLIAIAAAITYANAWAHELTTWGNTNFGNQASIQDYSAFSPEDLSSNIIGIEAATRAINAMQTQDFTSYPATTANFFNRQMDTAIAGLMVELKAVPEAQTDSLLDQVQYVINRSLPHPDLTAKWWMPDLSPTNGLIRLLRRNFNGAAWKIPGAAVADTPPWLTTMRFQIANQQFLYVVNPGELVDPTQVPATTQYADLGESESLRWVSASLQPPPSAAIQSQVGQNACLVTKPVPGKPGTVISRGQYAYMKLTVDPQPEVAVFANMQDITTALDNAFVKVNPNMDGPITYTVPAPAK